MADANVTAPPIPTQDFLIVEAINHAADSVNNLWKIIGIALVFWMHAGFSMLEAGSIREKNVQNILFKNLLNVVFTTLVWWAWGYAFAFGKDEGNFWGGASSDYYLGIDIEQNDGGAGWIAWSFQWAFAATAVTIISGGMAERANTIGYIITIVWFQLMIYPVVCHWVWGPDGWLGRGDPDGPGWLGFHDYAGSAVVHMVGGIAAFVGCYFLGPRTGVRKSCSIPNVVLGTFILWMGWYGFNGASGDIVDRVTLRTIANSEEEDGTNFIVSTSSDNLDTTGRVICNTTIAASAGGIFTLLIFYIKNGMLEVPQLCNGILAGLVAITAPCNNVTDWASFVIGMLASISYLIGVLILDKLDIDDAIGAFPVHGCCGIWGIIATGLFDKDHGWFYDGSTFMAWQIYGILAIIGWVGLMTAIIVKGLDMVNLLRVDEETELKGLDRKYHRTASVVGVNSYRASKENLS